jgi:hypothetical protein
MRATLYMPVHLKSTMDFSKYYIKNPEELSRREMAELEKEV